MSPFHVLISPFQIGAKKSIEKLHRVVVVVMLFFFNPVQFIQTWFSTFSPGLTQLWNHTQDKTGSMALITSYISFSGTSQCTVVFHFPCLSVEPQTLALSGILTLFPSGHRCLHHLFRLTCLLSYHCILFIKQHLWADLFCLSLSV